MREVDQPTEPTRRASRHRHAGTQFASVAAGRWGASSERCSGRAQQERLVLLQQEATELLALFDQLRGEAALNTDADPCLQPRGTGAEPTVRVTN
ncbi:hypothetical protein OZ13_00245 [Xanthomonas cannabis pv. cannabis]|nr:hypothetical protein OZ10_12115 [Xanthomonas cannabis pv. cannabis]KHL60117.1 hypothetical protein OZ13_00245 [Xanthomonas cannabis pv. cannabis]